MKDFVQLVENIDQTTKSNAKIQALTDFFAHSTAQDKLWCIAILSHRRPKRAVKTNQLRTWIAEIAELPDWLFEESYHIVGDLAETIAKLHPNKQSKNTKSLSEWIDFIQKLASLEEEEKKEKLLWAWNQLNAQERFIFNKLLTGGWRIGLSQKMMCKALAKHTGIEEAVIAHRLMGDWTPTNTSYKQLIVEESENDMDSKPYPFYLAYGIENSVEELGEASNWLAEWKWDGIRGQIIVRNNTLYVWSRGEELITERFPEFLELTEILPNGTVLDGEIIAYKNNKPLPFHSLQKRIGRKTIGKKLLNDVPVNFIAYDLLELNGADIRHKQQSERRKALENLLCNTSEPIHLSPLIEFNNWDKLKTIRSKSRENHAEGLMLKRKNAAYQTGRKKGDWWKWKIDPLTIDAVLLYAMRGHGRRANLYTDYTFAVWDKDQLVSFTKAYSGLTDAEFRQVDAFVKKNVIDKFGPVRSVKPELVFEIAFEGIAKSSRHKSGVALRFPRMLRWRKDKKAEEANKLEDLYKLVELYA